MCDALSSHQPARIPITEDEQIVPGSPYGESKFILERVLYWLDRTHGLRYAALRYFNAAGATAERGEDHKPETHLIPLVLQVALGQRAQIEIYGTDYPTRDGTCVRDYIHVLDLAQAGLYCARGHRDGPPGDRSSDTGGGWPPAARRPARVGRQFGQDPAGVELAASLPRSAGHCPQCLGVAQSPSPGLWGVVAMSTGHYQRRKGDEEQRRLPRMAAGACCQRMRNE